MAQDLRYASINRRNQLMSPYRGSMKHKNRPSTGRKGTLCPEWTHVDEVGRFSGDPYAHTWETTVAHRLFESATSVGGRKYATENGIAFEAKPTADGTWHGFPIPWESVPPDLLGQWLMEKKVTARQVKLNWRHDLSDVRWAIGGDAL